MLGTFYSKVSDDMQIIIPREVAESANITPGCEIVIVGMGDHFEIWEQSAWDTEYKTIEDSEMFDILTELDL